MKCARRVRSYSHKSHFVCVMNKVAWAVLVVCVCVVFSCISDQFGAPCFKRELWSRSVGDANKRMGLHGVLDS